VRLWWRNGGLTSGAKVRQLLSRVSCLKPSPSPGSSAHATSKLPACQSPSGNKSVDAASDDAGHCVCGCRRWSVPALCLSVCHSLMWLVWQSDPSCQLCRCQCHRCYSVATVVWLNILSHVCLHRLETYHIACGCYYVYSIMTTCNVSTYFFDNHVLGILTVKINVDCERREVRWVFNYAVLSLLFANSLSVQLVHRHLNTVLMSNLVLGGTFSWKKNVWQFVSIVRHRATKRPRYQVTCSALVEQKQNGERTDDSSAACGQTTN